MFAYGVSTADGTLTRQPQQDVDLSTFSVPGAQGGFDRSPDNGRFYSTVDPIAGAISSVVRVRSCL